MSGETANPEASSSWTAVKAESSTDAAVEDALPKRKRPGPKRDSRPAQSEKLERNRQAQRSHRERKEQYTQSLEKEVMRMKELFSQVCRERDAVTQERDAALLERSTAIQQRDASVQQLISLRNENSALRDMLSSHGIAADSSVAPFFAPMAYTSDVPSGIFPLAQQSTQVSASDGQSPSIHSNNSLSVQCSPNRNQSSGAMTWHSEQALSTTISDTSVPQLQHVPDIRHSYARSEQAALDFILALERPCMGHVPYLVDRAHHPSDEPNEQHPDDVPDDNENTEISGHALLVSAPTMHQVLEKSEDRFTNSLPDLKYSDIERLFNLSAALQPNEVELPAVRAWKRIIDDPRAGHLSVEDFEKLKENLVPKVECNRFGATVRVEEVDQALDTIFDAKIISQETAAFA